MPECARCEQHYVEAPTGDPLGAPHNGDDWVCFSCHPRLDPPDLPSMYNLPTTVYLRAVATLDADGRTDPAGGVPSPAVAEYLNVPISTARKRLKRIAADDDRLATTLGIGPNGPRTTYYRPDTSDDPA